MMTTELSARMHNDNRCTCHLSRLSKNGIDPFRCHYRRSIQHIHFVLYIYSQHVIK